MDLTGGTSSNPCCEYCSCVRIPDSCSVTTCRYELLTLSSSDGSSVSLVTTGSTLPSVFSVSSSISEIFSSRISSAVFLIFFTAITVGTATTASARTAIPIFAKGEANTPALAPEPAVPAFFAKLPVLDAPLASSLIGSPVSESSPALDVAWASLPALAPVSVSSPTAEGVAGILTGKGLMTGSVSSLADSMKNLVRKGTPAAPASLSP